jgi:hypothetical protein
MTLFLIPLNPWRSPPRKHAHSVRLAPVYYSPRCSRLRESRVASRIDSPRSCSAIASDISQNSKNRVARLRKGGERNPRLETVAVFTDSVDSQKRILSRQNREKHSSTQRVHETCIPADSRNTSRKNVHAFASLQGRHAVSGRLLSLSLSLSVSLSLSLSLST